MNQEKDDKPWYKYGLLWLVIALPASAVIAGITTVFIAAHKPDSLVVDDYYKDGLAINEVKDKDRKARDLGLVARMEFSGEQVRLFMSGDEPAQITLRLIHPTQAERDQVLNLQAVSTGLYLGEGLKALTPVSWKIRLEDEDSTWRMEDRYNPSSGAILEFSAS
jgi:hypothetical protein